MILTRWIVSLTCFIADWFIQLNRLMTNQLHFFRLPEHSDTIFLAS